MRSRTVNCHPVHAHGHDQAERINPPTHTYTYHVYIHTYTAELQTAIASMHTDMTKLNELIGKNQEMFEKLEGNTFTLEADFSNSLKDLEEDAIRIESTVRSTLDQKERIKEELIEMERVIMETERKIELEKEMQSAYMQKDEGSEVMIGMKREIHRMQLRYAQLMRRQEELMVEMERAIFKRDAISTRGKIKQVTQSRAGTHADVKKMVADLGKRVSENEGEISRYDKQIRQLDAEGKELGKRMEEAGASVKEAQREEDELHQSMHQIDKRKAALKDEIYSLQRMVKRYQALEQGRYEAKNRDEVAASLQRAQDRRAQLLGIMQQLTDTHPELEASLGVFFEAQQQPVR
jgi:chromosome segregation ATPase